MAKERILLCVSNDQELINHLKRITKFGLLNNKEVHLLNVFKQEIYTNEFAPYSWPTEDKFGEIKATVETVLSNLAEELKPHAKDSEFKTKCILNYSPKKVILDYIKENKISLVAVATKGKHGIEGLFSGSTTEFLVKYSPCDIFVIRPD